ncbi:hypothetical protein EBU71_18900, partial [bacterium]|nr:hypothetical protein [Candidatus Elulimicrobium humile]
MTNLFVVTRGGIGDHLISSGIINHLSETNFVNLACWKDWVPTLESLYCENPNIKIHPVQDYLLGPFHDRDMKKQAEKFESKFIGLGLHTTDMKNYYRIPYIEQKLPFEYMYSKFKLPSKIDYDEAFLEIMKPKNPYVLLNIWDKLG